MADIGMPDPYGFLKVETPEQVKWLMIESKKREIESTIARLKEDIKDYRDNKIKQIEAKIIMFELQKAKLDQLTSSGDLKFLPE